MALSQKSNEGLMVTLHVGETPEGGSHQLFFGVGVYKSVSHHKQSQY